MTVLFPKLSGDDATRLLETLNSAPLRELECSATINPPGRYFLSTGGNPVSDQQLKSMADRIDGIARDHGYPDSRTRDGLSGFDSACAAYLAESWTAARGEALRPESWAFVAVAMLPHVSRWRFETLKVERVWGSVYRNVFGRLWLRGELFGRPRGHPARWELLDALGEDTFVSIVERPSLSGNPAVARAIGETWLKTRKALPQVNMETLNREAVKRIRLMTDPCNLDVIDSEELAKALARVYLDTARSMTKQGII
jgi:hypothetical protein